MTADHFPVVNSYPGPAVAIDLDGTLAPHACGDVLGPPSAEHAAFMARLRDAGVYVVVFSARPPAQHPHVAGWLAEHHVAHDQIALGTKPAADLFVDDKGLAAPLDVAESWLWWRLAGRRPAAVADGTMKGPLAAQMASCYQNPDALPRPAHVLATFSVVVPVSAGIDSTCAWLMALAADYPVSPVYVDTGAAYSAEEWAAVQRLHAVIGGPEPERVHVPVEYQKFDYVDLGRNFIIVRTLAGRLAERGEWGEVWLGNLADFWSETPWWGGDKSSYWLMTVNQMLALDGLRVRLVSPLGAMSKFDAVAWAVRRGHGHVMPLTRSCYAERGPCGRCLPCWRRWMALTASDLTADWPDGYDFDPFWAAAADHLAEPRNETWGPGRTAELRRMMAEHAPQYVPTTWRGTGATWDAQ